MGQTAADLALALLEARVEEGLEDEHAKDDRGRAPEAPAALAQRITPRQGRRDEVRRGVIVEDRVDLPQGEIPELVTVGEGALLGGVRATLSPSRMRTPFGNACVLTYFVAAGPRKHWRHRSFLHREVG